MGVILLRRGDVFLLLTADLEQGVPIDDDFFARRTIGRAAELTQNQLRELRDYINALLD